MEYRINTNLLDQNDFSTPLEDLEDFTIMSKLKIDNNHPLVSAGTYTVTINNIKNPDNLDITLRYIIESFSIYIPVTAIEIVKGKKMSLKELKAIRSKK